MKSESRGIWCLELEKTRQKLQFYQSRSLLECEMIHAQSACSLHCRSQDFSSDMTRWFIPTPGLSVRLGIACCPFPPTSLCHKVICTAQTSLYVSGEREDVICAGIWRFGPPKSDSCSVSESEPEETERLEG